MARPSLNDDHALVEIAIIKFRYPDLAFSKVVRRALEAYPVASHSDDATRVRLHRKFKARPDYWVARGRDELAARRRASIDDVMENITMMGRLVNTRMMQLRPTLDAMAANLHPTLMAFQARMNDPQVQRSIQRMTEAALIVGGRLPR